MNFRLDVVRRGVPRNTWHADPFSFEREIQFEGAPDGLRGHVPCLVYGCLADIRGRPGRCHGGNARRGSDDLQPELDRALGVLGADSFALERDRLRVDRV